MTAVLHVGNQTITAEEVLPLLTNYQIMPQLLREIVIEQAIIPFTCTDEEKASACQQLYQKKHLHLETEQQAWLERNGMTPEQLEALLARRLRIEKFKQATWECKLESYFLHRKRQLDQVIFSLLRTTDMGIAQELYFRLQEKEQSFADLAQEYSQGPEAQTGGFVGPVELNTLHPALAQMLSASQPGQLWFPFALGEWVAIVRLEKLIPAQLDEPMRQQLLGELFEAWIQKQVSQHLAKVIQKDRVQNC
ncbi:peptidylprolyl isomerase [Hydrococcus rivularis NIES-593]|uniref:peptidylprolyl isomerase n=1 Tax=Hydrococcus rivularis NIES-593 TaxID=1921803 RepID=A0A1U7H9F9_9CYAN|nr:peptidylprolyl isomerase [Hydrococcus rivularis]OKH20216.1 peptidylprolyl isomerase [Hydrococcus rivularis NIES-593]